MPSKKKIEPYPLYNRARARHELDTKTNRCAPKTHATISTYRKIAPDVHSIPTHAPKPAARRLEVEISTNFVSSKTYLMLGTIHNIFLALYYGVGILRFSFFHLESIR